MQTVKIERLGHQGDGIAEGPIYVPGVLPGETVMGEVAHGIMADPRIETPSEFRIKAPCSHAKSCGGCQLQHARDDFTANWKRDVVLRALGAQGVTPPELGDVITSPPQSRRRATFTVRRTRKGALAGFHIKRSDTVVSIPNCQLVTPQIAQCLPMLEELATIGASRKAPLAVLVIEGDNGLDLTVSGGKEMDTPLRAALADFGNRHGLTRLTWDDESLNFRPAVLTFDGIEVTPPPGAFLQATSHGEQVLREAVVEIVGKAKRVLDLFSGCGTFALPLSKRARVHAVEGDRAMTTALNHGWRMGKDLRDVTHETRDLFRNPLLPDELDRFDAVVIDPPRAGAEAQIAQMAKLKIPVIAHVSCNPLTFARDAKTLLDNGYALTRLDIVDQFRWSTHVELVGAFTRA